MFILWYGNGQEKLCWNVRWWDGGAEYTARTDVWKIPDELRCSAFDWWKGKRYTFYKPDAAITSSCPGRHKQGPFGRDSAGRQGYRKPSSGFTDNRI